MQFSLDNRTCSLGVGEFADFTLGPRDAVGGPQGYWRAQLGRHWHDELRRQTAAEHPDASFEVPVHVDFLHGGWTLSFSGRIDQLLATSAGPVVREIKTVIRPLPADESALRADYPSYVIQLATYAALLDAEAPALRAELIFVEASSGLAQTVVLGPGDAAIFRTQLEHLVGFLNLRLRARKRLANLDFRPPFAGLRSGQETIQRDLESAFSRPSSISNFKSPISNLKSKILLFEAPTGYGKTGVLLEFALGQLRAGRFARVIYLTGKATGQLQVVRTLEVMTAQTLENQNPKLQIPNAKPETPDSQLKTRNPKLQTPPPEPEIRNATIETPNPKLQTRNSKPAAAAAAAVAAWQVRPKSEHCVNQVFHCVRAACSFLEGAEARWPQSGLARFWLFDGHARDIETLRAAGRAARICPYEITRAALAFNDVWIADYNYVFAPANRTLFFERPGFDPAQTLLLIDEAHNLPSRVASAHSHAVTATGAQAMLAALDHLRAPAELVNAWKNWTEILAALGPADALDPESEAGVAAALHHLAGIAAITPLDHAALGPHFSALLWQIPELAGFLADPALEKLLWTPRGGELHFTCLDAASAIGETMRQFGGVILASATLQPCAAFAATCGLDPALGANLLADDNPASGDKPAPAEWKMLAAPAPWRDGAYDLAIDLRVDTTFHQRVRHHGTTAATIEALHAAACAAVKSREPRAEIPGSSVRPPTQNAAVAVFFPSYAYAEAIVRALETRGSTLRTAMQPRLADLAAQAAWVEESLALADALFLILGSSFTESIDLLGGRVTHAMVVGPALPEVNAVQKARRTAVEPLLGRAAAFRRIYQIPGMQKVNQALGRLVRAPGQRARVLLHCRRFVEPDYAGLLAPEYQFGAHLATDADLAAWLETAG